jgi:hypothetical protein
MRAFPKIVIPVMAPNASRLKGSFPNLLANCTKARSASIYDRCKAVYEGLLMRKCSWQQL